MKDKNNKKETNSAHKDMSNYKKAFFYKDLKKILEDKTEPMIDFDTGKLKTSATIFTIEVK